MLAGIQDGEGFEISIQYADGNGDILEQVGPLVLAVYAVKVCTDPTEPDQVTTLDVRKESVLRDIFWKTVLIDYKTVENSYSSDIWIDQAKENLKIWIKYASEEDLINVYMMNEEQKDLLSRFQHDQFNVKN